MLAELTVVRGDSIFSETNPMANSSCLRAICRFLRVFSSRVSVGVQSLRALGNRLLILLPQHR